MILGIGTDIIEIERIDKAIKDNPRFIYKVFTEKEIEYLEDKGFKPQHAAGGFAAKEAISKALGTGFREFSMKDIEIYRDNLGKPKVLLYRKAEELAKIQGDYMVHLSISHDRDKAIAYAILEVK